MTTGDIGLVEIHERPSVAESSSQARQRQVPIIPEATKDLAAAIHDRIEISQKTKDATDKKQEAIYVRYQASLKRIIERDLSVLLPSDREKILADLANILAESYRRINNIDTLKPEIEVAANDIIEKNAKMQQDVTESELGTAIAKKLYTEMLDTFHKNKDSAMKNVAAALTLVLEQIPHLYSIESVNKERKLLGGAFDKFSNEIDNAALVAQKTREAENAFKKATDNLNIIAAEAEQELATLQKPAEETVKDAISTFIADQLKAKKRLPIYIAPNRDISTELPQLPVNEWVSKPKDYPEIKKTFSRVAWVAGRKGIIENCYQQGDIYRIPAAAFVTVGFGAVAAGGWSRWPAIGAGLGSALTTSGFIAARDYFTASSDLKHHLNGDDLQSRLSKSSSSESQARVALSSRYGTDWLIDFEKWATQPNGMSLENAMTVSNSVREQCNHFLLLSQDSKKHTGDTSLDNPRFKSTIEAGITRYEREENLIKDHIETLGLRSRDEDYLGIRCLSHMRGGKVTDDVKKFCDFLKSKPVFSEADSLEDEAIGYIKERYKRSSSDLQWPDRERTIGPLTHLRVTHLPTTNDSSPQVMASGASAPEITESTLDSQG